MKAIVYEGVGKIVLKEVAPPKVRKDTIIVKVDRCAICGTDVKAYTIGISSIKPPVILGHEFVGKIFQVGSDHNLIFGSSGSVYGFELRFYPGGRYSSFSLGVSIEKTHMSAKVEGPVTVQFNDGSHAEMDAEGNIELNPLFTNLSFRWDIKPSWAITPYFILGLGVAALNGEVSYKYNGTYFWAGGTEDHEDEDSRDIKEAEEDTDFNLPNILPLLQITLGVRAEVIPHLHLRAEAGVWNGIILRAGLAYKF